MFHVYKNGICISGMFDAIYTDDPQEAYMQMLSRMHRNRYFIFRLHPEWAKSYSLRNMHHHIDMGKPYAQAVTVIAEGEKDPHGLDGLQKGKDSHGLDGLNGLQKGKDPHGLDELDGCEVDEFYDPLDHPDRERHIPCCGHPNGHFGE